MSSSSRAGGSRAVGRTAQERGPNAHCALSGAHYFKITGAQPQTMPSWRSTSAAVAVQFPAESQVSACTWQLTRLGPQDSAG